MNVFIFVHFFLFAYCIHIFFHLHTQLLSKSKGIQQLLMNVNIPILIQLPRLLMNVCYMHSFSNR